jgi:hypothetical protein
MKLHRLTTRSALALMTLGALVACSESSDPAGGRTPGGGGTDTGRDTGSTDTGGSDTTDGDADTSAEDTGSDTGEQPDTSVDDGADTTVDTAVDTDTGNPGDTTVEDTGAPYECGSDPFFSGQVFGTDVPNGGAPNFVATPAEFGYADANLDEVIAAFPAEDPTDPITLDAPITVTGAIVVATNYYNDAAVPPSQSTFWVADANGTVEVRLDFADAANVPEFQVRVGHKINFTVTAVNSYFGTGQIQAATGWELVDTDNLVGILERWQTPATNADVGQMVRVEGTITGGGSACGGSSKCWTLSYADGATLTLRSASTFIELNQCVTFVGPLGSFNDAPQLNVANFDWMWTYR